jgi:REP element-mobilizing transposase RayT
MIHRSDLLQSTKFPFHIVNRGVNKGLIFFRPHDYEQFLWFLRDAKGKAPVTLLAFALMPNHFHLLLRQSEPYGISRFLKRVCEMHAKTVNRRRQRSGHLFQNRYRLSSLESGHAVLSTSWYIHNNPVKAGLVQSADLWSYSSMKEYTSKAGSGLVDREELLLLLAGYRDYFEYFRSFDPTAPLLAALRTPRHQEGFPKSTPT